MKRNKKYQYEIPNVLIRPFMFIWFAGIVAWRDSKFNDASSIELSDIPTWVIRTLGICALRPATQEYKLTGVLPSSYNMLECSHKEWLSRKQIILARRNVVFRVLPK